MAREWQMKWQKDFETFFPIYNTFLIDGLVDDDQPYKKNPDDDTEEVKYCFIEEYINKICGENPDKHLRKRVVVFDPVESPDKRFYIMDEDYDTKTESVTRHGLQDVEETKTYPSAVSDHLNKIFQNERIAESLIEHRENGATADFSKIHYAVNELNRFSDAKLNAFFGNTIDRLTLFGGNEPSGYLFIIKMASRLVGGDVKNLNDEENLMFRQLLAISRNLDEMQKAGGAIQHKLVILVNEVKDFPTWFTNELINPAVRCITITKPTEENRLAIFDNMVRHNTFGDAFSRSYATIRTQDGKDPIQRKYLAYTNDFSTKMLLRYGEYVSAHHVDDPSKINYSLAAFRGGDMTNPWDNEERVRDLLRIKEKVSAKLIGQDYALAKAQEILTRSAVGIDRDENPNAPRAVLFLAGPTGTGKTELCKQIAECVFGSEDRMVRFDMSEYGERESDQKLFGAPPGYVGYEEGGKLTNAIKKEPFSLILFDEIEKADNSILDKFLQILGDGRLTDGHGDTVRFTDCIIVITSNAGVNLPTDKSPREIEAMMRGDTPPEKQVDIDYFCQMEEEGKREEEIYAIVSDCLRYNVKAYFMCKLGRPELYGRVENALVYYNYVSKNAVKPIAKSKMKSVIKTIKENLAPYGLEDITYSEKVLERITRYCSNPNVRVLGARGVIKATGSLFSTSLGNFVGNYKRGYRLEGENRISLSMSDLRGKTLTCDCTDVITSANNITWRII